MSTALATLLALVLWWCSCQCVVASLSGLDRRKLSATGLTNVAVISDALKERKKQD